MVLFTVKAVDSFFFCPRAGVLGVVFCVVLGGRGGFMRVLG